MNKHLYRFTVEHINDEKGTPVQAEPLTFEVNHHEDLFSIVEKIKENKQFNETDSTVFAIGLKLFSCVMLAHRDNPLFEPILPHFREFMKKLKKR